MHYFNRAAFYNNQKQEQNTSYYATCMPCMESREGRMLAPPRGAEGWARVGGGCRRQEAGTAKDHQLP